MILKGDYNINKKDGLKQLVEVAMKVLYIIIMMLFVVINWCENAFSCYIIVIILARILQSGIRCL